MDNYKANYQLWDQRSFKTDQNVLAMTDVQRWMYMTLLHEAWNCNERPNLPTDDNVLWRLAGCDSKETWLQNKPAVVSMFSVCDVDGKQVYCQKRLQRDWDYVKTQRDLSVESGRRGGLKARSIAESVKVVTEGASSPPTRVPQPVKLSEVKLSKDELSKPINLPKSISTVSCDVLAYLYPISNLEKDALNALGSAFGQRVVLQDYTDWAESVKTTGVKYPVGTYIKIAPQRLGFINTTNDDTYNKLAAEVFEISNQAPTFQGITAAKQLLTLHSTEEIVASFREFYEGQTDDFHRGRAVQDFFEGGAGKPAIDARRKREEDYRRSEEILRRNTESLQQEAASKPEERDEFIENLLSQVKVEEE